ncbi:hypothetical protein BB8028_0012g00110 [Beauveria bassiana]|uniref:Uncharacterized protein n=1 Tax=Beauveria bassiana TaxID=176275 RepID=A0A2S7YQ72_BEABA|nr:hypothetical protein BB8028_0012g00110 [Beauveria bassiana]
MGNPSRASLAPSISTTRIENTSKFSRNNVHARAGSADPCNPASSLRVFISQAPTAVADGASPALTNNKGGKMGGFSEAPPSARRPATSLSVSVQSVVASQIATRTRQSSLVAAICHTAAKLTKDRLS